MVQCPCEQQSCAGHFGRWRDGEGGVEQRKLTDITEQVSGPFLQRQQGQQHLPVVQQGRNLRGEAEDFSLCAFSVYAH